MASNYLDQELSSALPGSKGKNVSRAYSQSYVRGKRRKMNRRKAIPFVATGVVLISLLVACSGYKAANQKNFSGALNTYYLNHEECLYPSALRFPYETDTKEKTPGLDALTGAGLLERTEEKNIHVKRFSLTNYGRTRVTPRFCYGHREVTSIDSFTPPTTVNGQQTTQVQYHYKLVDLPGWANSDQMRAAFPALAKASGDQVQDTAKLVLTPNGWRVPE
jgi:hypothetical protein